MKWRVCGSERVDDVVSGEIAASDVVGRYRIYLGQMTEILANDSYTSAAGLDNTASVNDFLLTQGLGDSPGGGLLPVFYWCANYDSAGVFDPIDSASFGWDLTHAEVYDIPGVRADLYTKLVARLDLYNPQIGLVPPVDRGYTFVQWPTWMFLENPLEEEWVYTNNNIDTFRIDLRARLLRIEWAYDGELVAECAASDMVQYDANVHDPIDDLPACHHVFHATEHSGSDDHDLLQDRRNDPRPRE